MFKMMENNNSNNVTSPQRSPLPVPLEKGQIESKKSNGVETNLKLEDRIFEREYLLLIVVARALALIVWTAGILYATYHVYLAAEEMLPFQQDPVMNPGPFTELLDRGRDTSDFEWTTFTFFFFSKLIFWLPAYLISTSVCKVVGYKELLPWISPVMSFLILWNITGIAPTLYLFLVPVIYWLIARTKSKVVVWTVTIVFLFSLSSSWARILFFHTLRGQEGMTTEYYFAVVSAWNYARCISFCFDTWDRPHSQTTSLQSLLSFWKYVFYFPLLLTGPLVMFEHFEKQILNKKYSKPRSTPKNFISEDFIKLMKGIFRMMLITVLNEGIYHYLYFRPLALTPSAIRDMNLWALCGCVYWLGQIFTLKYKVLYGIPSYVAEFDGLEMYPLPTCPAYLHRYSVLWKDFDRGLYLFLVRYIYVPITGLVRKVDKHQKLSPDIHKLIGSFASYVYVYVWHSTAFEVLVWAALNFLGITFEKIGSLIKRRIDSKFKIEPMIWDFLVEPIVTVPLAAMSILNSSVFCGSLESAIGFSNRLWADRGDNYVFLFLYCFTHVAVTIRTWDAFSQTVITNFKASSKKLM